ncbi:glutamine synthetase [Pseudomonas sp. RC10]|uniref:glutamine synthetase n=1 Tax=Pseudomonas bambusae TaxID=3139142 RepID=UPI00313A407D
MVRVSNVFAGFVALLLGTQVWAAPPSPRLDRALCTRSATLLACIDAYNNQYSVAMSGTTMYLRGYESVGNRTWAQTNSRYGSMTFFTGLASDGEAWVGYIQKVGWTTISRVSSSSGSRSKITCDRVMGCR